MEEINANTPERTSIEKKEADIEMGQSFADVVEKCRVKTKEDGVEINYEERDFDEIQIAWANYLHQIGQEFGFDYKSFEQIKAKLKADHEKLKRETQKDIDDESRTAEWREMQRNYLTQLNGLKETDSTAIRSFDQSLIITGDNYNEFHLRKIAQDVALENPADLRQKSPYLEFIQRLGLENSRLYVDYNYIKNFTEEEMGLVADLLGQEYKFHLMPTAEDAPFLLKTIHSLIAKHPRFGKLIWAFKFANFALYRKIIELAKTREDETKHPWIFFNRKFGDEDRVAPFFVVYPNMGYDVAQETADILKTETGNVTPSSIIPSLNDKISELIYVANGSGADKYTYLRLQTRYAGDEEEFREAIEIGGLLDPDNLAYAKGARHII